MRIVIADDEQWVRAALKSMLLEIDSEIEMEGEASDGSQMVKLIEEKQPDMAFVDIKMPGMNGLEAIESVKEASPDTSWVILSGFSDFPYAKKAIALGVEEYLLKPVKLEELRHTLQNIRKAKEQGKRSRNAEFQHFLISNFYASGGNSRKEGYFDSFMIMEMEICIDTWKKGDERKEISERIKNLLAGRMEELDEQGNVYSSLFEISPEKSILAVGFPSGKTGKKEEVIRWFHSLKKEFQKISDRDIAITGFLSPCEFNVQIVTEYMKKREKYECLRSVLGVNKIWNLEELHEKTLKYGQKLYDVCRAMQEVTKGMQNRSYLNFMECIVKAEREYDRCSEVLSETMKANLKFYFLMITGLYRIMGNNTGYGTISEMFSAVREHAKELLSDTDKIDERWDVVRLTEEYIQKNYARDISIGQIADSLNLTPNYLSAVFHKGVGTTFVKYLTRVRMNKAEELLQNENLTINQVATLVGYTDTRYFSKVFKEYFGVLPSEYGKRRKRV